MHRPGARALTSKSKIPLALPSFSGPLLVPCFLCTLQVLQGRRDMTQCNNFNQASCASAAA